MNDIIHMDSIIDCQYYISLFLSFSLSYLVRANLEVVICNTNENG